MWLGLRLFAVPHINETAVGQIEVMRHAHYIVHVACCRIYILNVCVAGYFSKSSEFMSCFQKAPNYSFIVLQNFHWNVSALRRRSLWGKYFMWLCHCPSARLLHAHTRVHARTHTSHQLNSPSAYRRVYELLCSRTCMWCDTYSSRITSATGSVV